MTKKDQREFRETGWLIVRWARYWLGVILGITIILHLVEPAPGAYLLASLPLGLLWSGCLTLAWRLGSSLSYLLFVAVMSGSAHGVRELFLLENQVQGLQGLLIGLGGTGLVFVLFSGTVVRFGRLEKPTPSAP